MNAPLSTPPPTPSAAARPRRAALNGWMTAEEFQALPEYDGIGKRELVDGRVTEMSPPGYDHGSSQLSLGARLLAYVRANGLGNVVTEVGFVLQREPDIVRLPDIAFLRKDRLPSGRDGAKQVDGAPDLAIELLSPTDSLKEMEEKVDDYLAAGTGLVWLVNFRRQTVTIFRRGVAPKTLGLADNLDGEDVLPGFSMPVTELFN